MQHLIIPHQFTKLHFYNINTKLPVTDWAAAHVISLPIHPKVTQKDIEFIGKSIHELL